jgi:hypothetical protein
LVFLVLEGYLQLLDGNFAIVVEVDLTEEISEVFDLFLGELSCNVGGCYLL